MTTTEAVQTREFKPGTTGWTADDLDNPAIERQWEDGAYEIVEGVLALMPPAYHDGTLALARLRRLIERHLDETKVEGDFTAEDDLVLGPRRVARADLIFMTPADHKQQEAANRKLGKKSLRYGRILVPPTLVVEAMSIGHEVHDADTKRTWYAEARIPNYWLFDPFHRTLECLILKKDAYRVDVAGKKDDRLTPSLFPGLQIELKQLWL